MSLFGRRRSFGFSRGMGDALARPAYLDALGQVGMLAGSLPQRRKEEQRQAEEMKISAELRPELCRYQIPRQLIQMALS